MAGMRFVWEIPFCVETLLNEYIQNGISNESKTHIKKVLRQNGSIPFCVETLLNEYIQNGISNESKRHIYKVLRQNGINPPEII
jgi:hypothetical protein